MYVIVFRILDGDKDSLGSIVMEGEVDQLMVQVQIVIVVRDATGLWTIAEINKDDLCDTVQSNKIINYLGPVHSYFNMKAFVFGLWMSIIHSI